MVFGPASLLFNLLAFGAALAALFFLREESLRASRVILDNAKRLWAVQTYSALHQALLSQTIAFVLDREGDKVSPLIFESLRSSLTLFAARNDAAQFDEYLEEDPPSPLEDLGLCQRLQSTLADQPSVVSDCFEFRETPLGHRLLSYGLDSTRFAIIELVAETFSRAAAL